MAFLAADRRSTLDLLLPCASPALAQYLREIGLLSGKFRIAMARHRELTFSATTAHLCSAVRKLADVTRDGEAGEAGSAHGSVTLFRAVRGELPPAFWDADRAGMISAVDSAFMSTSRNR